MGILRIFHFPSDRSAPRDCTCGHAARAHEHYRRGSDCALCTCPKFRAGAVARRPRDAEPDAERDPRGERVPAA
jgi:hypothetical protein